MGHLQAEHTPSNESAGAEKVAAAREAGLQPAPLCPAPVPVVTRVRRNDPYAAAGIAASACEKHPPVPPGAAPQAFTIEPCCRDPSVPVVHARLAGRVAFLPFHSHVWTEPLHQHPSGLHGGALCSTARYFFGNISTAVESSALHAICYHLAQGPDGTYPDACAWEQHFKGYWKKGCGHAKVACADHAAFVLALHKRVLFDRRGVWYAADADQQVVLLAYTAAARALPANERRELLGGLPCTPMVVEVASRRC